MSQSPQYQTSHWTILECALAILRHQHYLSVDSQLKWGSQLLAEDFMLSIIHVCLGLRRNAFSDQPEPGQDKSAKELAWVTLRLVYENMKDASVFRVDNMKSFIGMSSLKAVLEARGSGASFDPVPVIRKAAFEACDVVEELLRAKQLAISSSSGPSERTLDSMEWSPAASTPNSTTNPTRYNPSPWIMNGIIDPALGVGDDQYGEFDAVRLRLYSYSLEGADHLHSNSMTSLRRCSSNKCTMCSNSVHKSTLYSNMIIPCS